MLSSVGIVRRSLIAFTLSAEGNVRMIVFILNDFMFCMISPMSITNLNSIIEIEFSNHYITVCVPEPETCDMRGCMRAIQIQIIGL